jgi:hypothetical protein
MAVHKYSLLELQPFFVKPSSFAVVIVQFFQDFFIVRVNVMHCGERKGVNTFSLSYVKQRGNLLRATIEFHFRCTTERETGNSPRQSQTRITFATKYPLDT